VLEALPEEIELTVTPLTKTVPLVFTTSKVVLTSTYLRAGSFVVLPLITRLVEATEAVLTSARSPVPSQES
jgi:hypothetical protein